MGLPYPPRRFDVGSQVVCRTGDGLRTGCVVALNYREPHFRPDFVAPYQVKLDDGRLIFVPKDSDKLCSRRVFTWWEELFTRLPNPKMFANSLDELRGAVQGQDVNKPNHDGRTALFEALRLRWLDGVTLLLNMGASANVINGEGASPLHQAVRAKGADDVHVMVLALLEARADPNAQDKDKNKDPDFKSTTFKERKKHRTPLHYCAEKNYLRGAAALLKAAANPNMIDAQYKTPLHLAIDEHSSRDMVTLLLQGRADPDKGNIEIGMSSSYLMLAARNGNADIASALIKARAFLDKVGKQGMTALHMAARSRHENVAKLLIEAKCDISIKAMGKTAQELAVTNGSIGLAVLLGFEDQNASSTFQVQTKELYLN